LSRDLKAGADAALQAAHVDEIVFLEFDFLSGTSRVCSREHSVEWNGFTWLGAGRVGSVEALAEGGELEARGIAMTLSGLTGGLLATALTPAEYKGRAVRMWCGQLDRSSVSALAIVADPIGPFLFKMDQLSYQLGQTATIRLTAESRLADWQRPRVRRYNQADHQVLHPGDKFFEHAEKQVEAVHLW
jgi:hypothetical protein